MRDRILKAAIFLCAVIICSIIVACGMYLFEYLGAR